MTTEEQTTIDTLMELKQLLQTENEHLYQQYNHLLIRNQKLMKRIDDQQQLNDRLQGRIAALENIIDKLRLRHFIAHETGSTFQNQNDNPRSDNDNLNEEVIPGVQGLKSNDDLTQLISRWGSLAA